MIIDFTRKFTDEEFASYQELVDLWWEEYENFRRDEYELEDQPYDPLIDYETPSIVEPTDWMSLIESGVVFDKYPGKENEIIRLDLIHREMVRAIDEYKNAGYIYEIYWPDDGITKIKIMKLFSKRDSKFVFIFNPHPRLRDILLMKDSDDYKEMEIIFGGKRLTELEFQWLVDYRGWRGTHRVDKIDTYNNLRCWLYENCSGNWRFSLTTHGSIENIYFELEEDLIFYRLRFTATEG